MDQLDTTLSGQDQYDLTKWILNLNQDQFSQTFSRLKLRKTGDQTKDFLTMLRRLAGNYTAEDFEIDSDYATLNEEEIKLARDTLRDEVVADLAKDNPDLSRHLMGILDDSDNESQQDNKSETSQHSDISQISSASALRKNKNITKRAEKVHPQVPGVSEDNPFSPLLRNDQFTCIPWKASDGTLYNIPQGAVADFANYKQMALTEINLLKKTTQECINIKSVLKRQVNEVACSTQIPNPRHSFPISGQVGDKHVQINDTFDINYFEKPSLGESTVISQDNNTKPLNSNTIPVGQ